MTIDDDTVDTVVDGQADGDDAAQNAEDERRARKLGWKPREEYTGAADRWVPAGEFLDHIMANRPGFERRLEQMESRHSRETAEVQAQLREVTERLNESRQVLGELNETQKRIRAQEYERAKRDLLEQQRTAVQNADTDAYDRASQSLQELDREHAPPKQVRDRDEDDSRETRRVPSREQWAEKPAISRRDAETIDAWIEENPWFKTDRAMHDLAVQEEIRLKGAGVPLDERLAGVKRYVKEAFPHKFRNTARDAPSATIESRGGERPSGGKKGRRFEDLPADDKVHAERLLRTIPGFTKEQFLAEYIWPDDDQRMRA